MFSSQTSTYQKIATNNIRLIIGCYLNSQFITFLSFPITAEFQRIICKVNEMKSQRSKFMDDLREDMLSDDITKKLVLHKNKEMSEIFQSELTKHDNKTKIIEQNLLAQENIIRAMTEINAKYAPTRREVANLIEARKEKIQSLMDSFQAYENLLLKAKKAVDFYEQLNTNIQDLAKKVEKTMLDNEKEKDTTIAKLTSTPKGNLKIFILT